jgi:RadC-like JAB domain
MPKRATAVARRREKNELAPVAYEEAAARREVSFEASVRRWLERMGSADPDADMARSGDYVARARDAGLDPQIVASTVWSTAHVGAPAHGWRRDSAWGAEERPTRPGYYAVDPTGKIIAGPFENRHKADDRARPVNGYVQFEAGEPASAAAGGLTPGIYPVDPNDQRSGHAVRAEATSAGAADCGCKHGESLKKPLKWHRMEAGEGYYAECPLGKFQVKPQRSDRRQGVAAWALQLDAIEIRSFETASDGKAYAQAYGEIVPLAAGGQAVAMDRPGKLDARPFVGGQPLAVACQPWVRVTRDPDAFLACMTLAREVGPVDHPKKIFSILQAAMLEEDQEVYLVIMTDVRDSLRGIAEVARGQRDRVMVDTVDILRPVIITGATNFWVAHNHPSSSSDPSAKDKRLTKQIAEAAKTAAPDVAFRGHVVIGAKSYHVA